MIKKYFNTHPGATETPWFSGSSSFITDIKYNKEQGSCYIKMEHGTTYEYRIGIDLADEFSLASSWGRFYNERIKSRYDYVGATESPLGALPDLVPRTAGEMWGMAKLATLVMPFQLSIPIKLGLAGAFIVGDTILSDKGIEKPPLIALAIDIASGYAITGMLKYPLSAGYAIAKTPYGSLKYIQNIGGKRLIGTMSRPQALMAVATGSKLYQSAYKSAERAYYIAKPGGKWLRASTKGAILAPKGSIGSSIFSGTKTAMKGITAPKSGISGLGEALQKKATIRTQGFQKIDRSLKLRAFKGSINKGIQAGLVGLLTAVTIEQSLGGPKKPKKPKKRK